MNCDLLLTEKSCRFCLGEAPDANYINPKTYFYVDKRLVFVSAIFEFLNLKINDETQNPDVPKRICMDCKKTIVAFYTLKKNFNDNEAVINGDPVAGKEKSLGTATGTIFHNKMLAFLRAFLKEHSEENLQINKYTDKLIVSPSSIINKTNCQKLTFNIINQASDDVCRKCLDRDSRKPKVHDVAVQCLLADDDHENSIHHNENSSDNSNDRESFVTKDNDISAEYLEEESLGQLQEDITLEEPMLGFVSINIKEEPDSSQEEVKPFACKHCEKTFVSRSGRDTHQQMKHKVPEAFSSTIDSDQVERLDETGKSVIEWKCSVCGHMSRRKYHHQTHIARHAIRESEIAIKKEIQECFVITKTTQAGGDGSPEVTQEIIAIETSPEQLAKAESARVMSTELLPIKNRGVMICSPNVDGNNIYMCSGCSSQFHLVENAKSHLQKYGHTGLCVSCVCRQCNVVFTSEKFLKRHQGFHSLAAIVDKFDCYECFTCLIVFSSQKDLNAHMSLHDLRDNYQHEYATNMQLENCEILVTDVLNSGVIQDDYQCAYCVKSGARDEIMLHVTFFHANLVCPVDKQEFSRNIGYFVDHFKVKHPEMFGGIKLTFSCPHCAEEFASKTMMKTHCSTCQSKNYRCGHCNKMFAMERQLKLHLAAVNGIKNHKCLFCDKSYTNKTEMNVHMRSHTQEKPYSCTFPGCNKAFRTNSHRSSHMDTHNLNKNHECGICKALFQTRGAKRVHEKTHTEASICQLCSRAFRQRSHYVRHVNSVHSIVCNSYSLEEAIAKHTKDEGSEEAQSEESNQ